ncbi:acyl-CoA dehydrogenase family protein [Paenibacillus alvei]|uniref:Acyl-CoA dehydrogenase n=2 Tax=Paenibacillus alvei TaxID=44250 RepID=A0AAP7A5U5_PAEAL|nr:MULTISPECIES: acyl-CoA dehydrogenase family protein [Paenibacillus]MBG9736004.1 acyl-CoA dehydrogenase [Paenibacillus alvei]MBG9742599.1 acyl-CoA dehydrogenase [Paenibacillus alvei]MCY9578217.1 acyl-CoA dehydrogenase family protein [Paenibacillus alvei]MCY9586695.1 acyl-CoA dehydrogenase family protein [Paenibacillus alvei]MCY9760716.1 acyl-CoA dehydrogenase family protein [Paenibacillus alvei]
MLEQKIKGGSFVIDDITPDAIITPEDFTEEQRMMVDTTRDFVEGEVLPHDEELEKLNYDLTVKLMRKAGEIGLLGADIPEEYGGLGLDKVSSTLIGETLTKASGFALSVGAHVGIGTLPIVFFGTPEQKAKYLPDLATGAKIAAYCLTEPSSGSDALSAKSTAKLSEDGSHYVLNGSKIFITNAGFADIFVVYAKVDGKDFTAFIVEKGMEGFTVGPEEKKMGIKSSSTCPLFFEDVKVPVENVLGEVGRGHVIAFNILNIGRFKLGAGCLGAAKEAIELSVKYAGERKQFGKALTEFSLVGNKLADMNIRTYVTESMVYRTSGLVDNVLKDIDYKQPDSGQLMAKAITEYALECSINKVFASEVLDFVADEGVQIHGGYGFTQEYKIERIYRDSRINRIFEGTNEINRLLIPGTLLKRAAKGELPLLQKAKALQADLMSIVSMPESGGAMEQEEHLVKMAKKIFLMLGGLAAQKYGTSLEQHQEILSNLADLMIAVYAMESALLRTRKLMAKEGEAKAKLAMQMTTVYMHEAFADIERTAKETLAAMESGDVLRTQLSILKKLAKSSPIDGVGIKREIAARVIQAEKYVVS